MTMTQEVQAQQPMAVQYAASPQTIAAPSFAWMFAPPAAVGPPASILIFGAPGTRKSSICGSLIKVPGFNRILYIDIDNGSEVLANDPVVYQAILEGRIQIVKINSLDADAFDKLNYIINEVCSAYFGFDAVVLDTIDVAQDAAEKNYKGVHSGNKDGFAVYGDLGIWTDEIARKLHNSPYFTAIITAHSTEAKIKGGAGGVKTVPKLSGSSKDAIGGIPSLVAYLEYKEHPETKQQLLLATVGQSAWTITKNRYNLPHEIWEFDMPTLYGMIAQRDAQVAQMMGLQPTMIGQQAPSPITAAA